jgi:hypothetical protein
MLEVTSFSPTIEFMRHIPFPQHKHIGLADWAVWDGISTLVVVFMAIG